MSNNAIRDSARQTGGKKTSSAAFKKALTSTGYLFTNVGCLRLG